MFNLKLIFLAQPRYQRILPCNQKIPLSAAITRRISGSSIGIPPFRRETKDGGPVWKVQRGCGRDSSREGVG